MGKDIFTVAQPASFQEISSYQARKVASNDFKNSRSILTKHDVSPIRFRWPIVPGIERWLLFSVRLRTPGLRIFNPPSSMEGVEGGRLHLFRLTHSTMTNLGFRNAWQKTVTVAAPFGCRSRLDRTSSHRIRGGVAGFNPTVNQLDCPYCPVQFEVMEISNVGQIVLNLKDFIVFIVIELNVSFYWN